MKIIFINDDAFLFDFIEAQGPRSDSGDKDLIKNVDRHTARTAFHPHGAGGGIDKTNVIKLIIADQIERREK